MAGRRAARRTALFLLYQWDLTRQPLASLYEGEVDPFARELAESATQFADRCDALTKLAPLDFEHLSALLGTTPDEVNALTVPARDDEKEDDR